MLVDTGFTPRSRWRNRRYVAVLFIFISSVLVIASDRIKEKRARRESCIFLTAIKFELSFFTFTLYTRNDDIATQESQSYRRGRDVSPPFTR
jgi:hypothetical protein